ncbi:hypothetical protein D9M68_705220 [compost metagenome]
MQRHLGAVHGEPRIGRAAVAEHQRGPVGGVHGAVVDHDGVAAQQLAVRLHDLADGRRAFFFLAVEDHLDVDRRLAAPGLQRVDGCQQHHDRALVVGRGPAEHAPLGVQRAAEERGRIDLFPLSLVRLALEHRRPRALLRPLRGDHRLAVEVHVEEHRLARRVAARELGEEHRLAAVGQLLRREAALAEGLLQPVDVLSDVFRHGGVVGQGQQLEVLAVGGLCMALGLGRREFGRLREAVAQQQDGRGQERHQAAGRAGGKVGHGWRRRREQDGEPGICAA